MVANISLTPKANVKHHELIFARQHFEASELSRPAIKEGALIIILSAKLRVGSGWGPISKNDLVAVDVTGEQTGGFQWGGFSPCWGSRRWGQTGDIHHVQQTPLTVICTAAIFPWPGHYYLSVAAVTWRTPVSNYLRESSPASIILLAP